MKRYYQVTTHRKSKRFRTEFFARRYFDRLPRTEYRALLYWENGRYIYLSEGFTETVKNTNIW